MDKLTFCGESDCQGHGVCPCRDWDKQAADLDEEAEKRYWEFDALKKGYPPFNGKMENGSERLAFKAIIKNLIRFHSSH